MGQIAISTNKFEILTGYDRRLDQYFLVVDDKNDNLIFSNLQIISGSGMQMSRQEVIRFIEGLGVLSPEGTTLEQLLTEDAESVERNRFVQVTASQIDD
jgi:hypothetical protein